MNADDLADDVTQILPTRPGRRPFDKSGASTHAPGQDADVTVLATPASGAVREEEESETLKIGSVLNKRFVLRQVLGSGGMGTVFRATDLRRQEAHDQQTDVALKVLNEEFRDDPELLIALQRETKKSQMLAHPNIVRVYDFDRDGRNIFMVMELLEGKTLSQYIREIAPRGGISFDEAWSIIEGLALALGYAHKKNIIHLDLKPGNIFITDSGEVKVLDFGIACATGWSDRHGHDLTVFNIRDLDALTPAYASLEMFENRDPDPRDDIYALACVSYELLAGKHPFGKLSAQKALEVNLQPSAIPGLKRRQWKAMIHALALKRADRTASIAQFLDEIAPKSPSPDILGAAAIAALIAIAGGYAYFSLATEDTPTATGSELPVAGDTLSVAGESSPVADEASPVTDEASPAANEAPPLADVVPPTTGSESSATGTVPELTPKQQLQIKDLLELAKIHFEVGYITAPAGSNASWAYREVLSIDPDNREAQQGLEKIADLLEKQAVKLFYQQKSDESLAKIEEGLKVQPEKESLLAMRERILQMKR